jgi:hypothetical protein
MARDGCRTPDGSFFAPDNPKNEGLEEPLVLHSGDSAWISTHERFSFPGNIAGTVTLKSHLANRGLLLLSGTVIDPYYGSRAGVGDRRLRFFVANLGTRSIVLTPEVTKIASVQFFTIKGPVPEAGDGPIPSAPPLMDQGLGFLERLKELQRRYSRLRKEVHRTRDLLNNLIVLGYFVLGTAVVSAGLATLLSIGSNEHLASDIERAVPDDLAGKGLAAAVALSLAWIIYSFALLFGPKQGLRARAAESQTDLQAEAIRSLREERRRRVAVLMLLLPFPLSVLIWAGDTTDAFGWDFWPIWVLVFGGALAGFIWLLDRLARPLDGSVIRERMNRLRLQALEAESPVAESSE